MTALIIQAHQRSTLLLHHWHIGVHSTSALIMLRSQSFASSRLVFHQTYWNKVCIYIYIYVFCLFSIIPEAQIYQMYTKGCLGNLYMHLWDNPISLPRSPTSPSKPNLRRSSSVAFNALMRVRDLAWQMLLHTFNIRRDAYAPIDFSTNFKSPTNPDAWMWLRHNRGPWNKIMACWAPKIRL